MIHKTAVIGDPPEHRLYRYTEGPFFYPLIHDTATIEAFCTVDAGCKGYTKVGAHSWLMKGVHVGHDAIIGEDCELAPHVSVGGHVIIGNHVHVGQGAVFKPFVKVGRQAVIGCGAVVVKDVPEGEVWAGNPARFLKRMLVGDLMTESEIEGWELLALNSR
jgi:UDP-N-acetylglucosamine acyltransferase